MPNKVTNADPHQADFFLRWGALRDPHVRALAWLLDSPDLLASDFHDWRGRVALSSEWFDQADIHWLHALDQHPESLHAALDIGAFTRLGRYAEQLLTFFFRYKNVLHAHGVQVRTEKGQTIGEFDFILDGPVGEAAQEGATHIEFATKLYLLEPGGAGDAADYFVGPNLTDTLGAKMRKIFESQLQLAEHPAAKAVLSTAIVRAQAMVKGWLFYHPTSLEANLPSVAADHCRGHWWELREFEQIKFDRAVVLPRLSWLAPAQILDHAASSRVDILQELGAYFRDNRLPVLIAFVESVDGLAVERVRGFVVPNDWKQRAMERGKSRPSLLE